VDGKYFLWKKGLSNKIMIKIKIFIFERIHVKKGSMPKVEIKLKDYSG